MIIRCQIYAAFCGTGKSYLCDTLPDKCIEFEDWNYRDGDFPKNYIKDIIAVIGNYEYIFIGTDPMVLKQLNEMGINIKLVYPKNELKSEYFKRFAGRESHIDFVNAINKYWNVWLDELKEQSYCEHIVLKKDEFLENIININRLNQPEEITC